MRWMRCTLTDDDREIEITADLLVDGDDRVLPEFTYFGQWRDSKKTYPLIFLRDDSAVDFGTDYGGPKDRYGELSLHGRIMSESTFFSYKDGAGEYELKILRCRDLADESNRGHQ